MTAENKLDAAMMEQLRDLLGDRFIELIETFINDGERRMNLLRDAVPKRDFTVVHGEAHGLKGSSRNIGANPLGNVCETLETIGDQKNEAPLDTSFAAVEQEFAAICIALREYLP